MKDLIQYKQADRVCKHGFIESQNVYEGACRDWRLPYERARSKAMGFDPGEEVARHFNRFCTAYQSSAREDSELGSQDAD